MKNTIHPLTFTRCLQLLLMLFPFYGTAQSSQKWSKPEEELASILLEDTVSHTISYLPKGYWFGLPDRSHGKLVLLKDGSRNYLLRDGTHQVHLLEKNKGKLQARRLDSSVFAGDNFLMMAFMRKDTIYQYGGYGFWNTRDFFMRYRVANRDWDFLSGGTGLPNELNYHYYDATSDAFYVIGSISSSHHPFARKILVDSVFRYDFKSRQWASLGKIRDDFKELDSRRNDPMAFCFTSYGFIDCRTFAVKLYDIPQNRILEPNNRVIDNLFNVGKNERLYDERYRLFIMLSDTLHVLLGKDDSISHTRIRITSKDFNENLPQRIYTPVDAGSDFDLNSTSGFLLIMLLPLAGWAGFRLYRTRNGRLKGTKHPDRSEPSSTESIEEEMLHPSYMSNPEDPKPSLQLQESEEDVTFFRSQLNPTELALLDMLLQETLSGNTADIHAINKTLGVSSKDASLQKARRSIAINNINSCFRQTFKVEDNLIIRERELEDKRAFVYKVDARYVDWLKG